jgi:hypothetical protein
VARTRSDASTGLTPPDLEVMFGANISWYQNLVTDAAIEFGFGYRSFASSTSLLHYGIRLSAQDKDTFAGFEREIISNGSDADTSVEIEFHRSSAPR